MISQLFLISDSPTLKPFQPRFPFDTHVRSMVEFIMSLGDFCVHKESTTGFPRSCAEMKLPSPESDGDVQVVTPNVCGWSIRSGL